jgi:tetratricopeptide (TPR) repeat protein
VTDDTAGYTRLLARAAARSGAAQRAAAAELWEQVTERNPVSGDNWSRLAEARFALKDYPAAVRAYGRVAELGVRPRRGPDAAFSEDLPYPSPAEVAYRVACCHAGRGDRERAIDALGEALTAGFRDLDRAREDELWESLREDSRVREMLGIVDTAGMSREEGWRADLRLLAREIKRRAYAPFAVVSEDDFDRAVGDLHGRIPGLSDAQIIIGMMKLLRPLGDGHAFINAPSDDEKLAAALPVEFYLFTEGVFVTAAGQACQRLLGARVDKIGGHPIAEVMAALDPVISRDNDQQVAFMAVALLRRVPFLHALGLTGEPGKAALAVRFPDGSSEDVTVDAAPSEPGRTYPYPRGWVALHDTMAAPPPLHLRNRDLAYWFSYLPAEELVYFQFNGVEDHPAEPFAAFCDRLFAFIDSHRSARLVIDVRWNGGGNTLLTQPLLHHLISSRVINRRGSLFVIIGRLTFSAAQNTVTAIERETHAIFVGEPTGSRPNFIGETIPFELPYSKVTANVADLYWQTSWPMDYRPWIAPDLYAPPTFEAYSQNRDPAMEAILASHDHLPGS